MSGNATAGTAAGAASRADVPSPCINVCQMDAASGLCRGCLRTLDEIASWSRAGDDEKRRILAAVDQRRAADTSRRAGAPRELRPVSQPPVHAPDGEQP